MMMHALHKLMVFQRNNSQIVRMENMIVGAIFGKIYSHQMTQVISPIITKTLEEVIIIIIATEIPEITTNLFHLGMVSLPATANYVKKEINHFEKSFVIICMIQSNFVKSQTLTFRFLLFS